MSFLQTHLPDAGLKDAVAIEWPGYIKACAAIAERHGDPVERALRRKRYKAMKYLDETASGAARGYKRAEPRIFTPEFVTELGAENSKARVRRNPWLASRMSDKAAAKSSASEGNILPFWPQVESKSQAVF